jgi:cytochrome c peroxidase
MKNPILITTLLVFVPLSSSQAEDSTVNNLLQDYAIQGATTANAEQGKQLWQKTFNNNGERSCASCHTKNLTQNGKHIKTQKEIKPMSPSVNPERLTDRKKINKWFKRNCKWTLGRECTAQEKTNFLVYIEKSSKFQE